MYNCISAWYMIFPVLKWIVYISPMEQGDYIRCRHLDHPLGQYTLLPTGLHWQQEMLGTTWNCLEITWTGALTKSCQKHACSDGWFQLWSCCNTWRLWNDSLPLAGHIDIRTTAWRPRPFCVDSSTIWVGCPQHLESKAWSHLCAEWWNQSHRFCAHQSKRWMFRSMAARGWWTKTPRWLTNYTWQWPIIIHISHSRIPHKPWQMKGNCCGRRLESQTFSWIAHSIASRWHQWT